MAGDQESLLRCLRSKSASQLTSFQFGAPSFLASIGPSKDGVLIANDFASPSAVAVTSASAAGGATTSKRAAASVNYTVVIGLSGDEASEALFAESETAEGMGPDTRDKYLRKELSKTLPQLVKRQA